MFCSGIKMRPLLSSIGKNVFVMTNKSRFSTFKVKNFIHRSRSRTFFPKKLEISVLVSSSLAGACLYYLLQRKHLCKEEACYTDTFEKYVHSDYAGVVTFCRDLLRQLKDEVGSPGIVIGVSVDGEIKWEEGLGYSDVENRVPCTRATVMRIASISKSITMTAVAKLWEEGKLDLDKPVQYYVPDFPKKTFDGKPVDITCRQLVSHLAGIRHYSMKGGSDGTKTTETVGKLSSKGQPNSKFDESTKPVNEFDFQEYYIKDKYADIQSSLQLFKDDPLVAKPGSSFHYSTHGWTLISAILEKASNETFTVHIQKLFKELGMLHTYLDVNDALIYHRSRNYIKDKRGYLVNAPYVDNSYKWAGGGFLSTVGDLLKFANAMLYSLQRQCQNTRVVEKNLVENSQESEKIKMGKDVQSSNISEIIHEPLTVSMKTNQLKGYLQPNTMKTIWYPVTKIKEKDWMYGMGWFVLPNQQNCEYCQLQRFCVAHTGGAVGASSVLLIMPSRCNIKDSLECESVSPPKGIVVTIITNLTSVNMLKVAYKIAEAFHNHSSKPIG